MQNDDLIDNGLKIYKRLLSWARQYLGIFIIGIIGTFAVSISDAGFTYLIKPIVDVGFVKKNSHFIHWLPLIVLVIFIIRGISSFVSTYFISRVSRNIVMDFRRAIFRHLLKVPANYYDQHSSGHILSAIIFNVDQVSQASSEALLTILREGTLLIGLVAVMFSVSWRLALLFLVVAPISFFTIKNASKRVRRTSAYVQQSVGQVTHTASEAINAYKLIRLYNGQAYEKSKFDTVTNKTRQRELKMVVTNSVMTAIVQLLMGVGIGLVIFFAVLPGWHISAGSFAAIVTAMATLTRPLRRITQVNTMIQQGIAGAASVFTLLDQPLETDRGVLTIERARGAVLFDRVSFRYNEQSDWVLKDISFEIKPGETLALVGRSGAGKSTLVNLLPRFYELSEGRIFLDGDEINTYQLQSLRNQFALVSQNPILFNDTIKHNIAYAATEVNDALLMDAASSAYALEFIRELPKQFNSIVGEDGVLLSGGQRQRIALARALYKKAPILILDEATSALDTHSERYIQEALNQLMKQCTTLVIAHRLSTVEKADRILVLDKGRIVESGTHRELLEKNGVYAELHQVQFSDA